MYNLSNFLYGNVFEDIERKMLLAINKRELEDIWKENSVYINLMKSDREEYMLYDLLYWNKHNLMSAFDITEGKKNVSTEDKDT
jgi:hypothetical protein|tara:strand:+ start:341 stop:592 length:252 start_codon:yes stop_codon:yes gene_type:complete